MITQLNVKDFNLQATLESGQVFGFAKGKDGYFTGKIEGNSVWLRQNRHILFVKSDSKRKLTDSLRNYFDLDRDLSAVYQILEEEDGLRSALQNFRGLRLIRQDSWEALACFIISSNNNVKRIQGIWKNLSLRLSGDKESFPKPGDIARSHERILRELGLGYRAPYLLRSAQFLSTNPAALGCIRAADYQEAKRRLLAFPGIGEKVADCVLLYGFQKYEAFPVDVWILRAMRKLYFKNRKVSEENIHAFGQKRWGKNAGYIQQYLFHSVRNGVI